MKVDSDGFCYLDPDAPLLAGPVWLTILVARDEAGYYHVTVRHAPRMPKLVWRQKAGDYRAL